MNPRGLLSIYLLANFKHCLIPPHVINTKKLNSWIPEVACVCSDEAVNIQADVGQSEIEHKEVTGIPHLLHREERHDANGIEEEPKHACRRGKQNVNAQNHKIIQLEASY